MQNVHFIGANDLLSCYTLHWALSVVETLPYLKPQVLHKIDHNLSSFNSFST